MRSTVYFLPLRTSVTASVGMSTLPILFSRPKACTRDSSDSFTLRSKPEYEWMMYQRMFGLRGGSAGLPPSGACVSAAASGVRSFSSSLSSIVFTKTKLPSSVLAMGEVLENKVHKVADGVVNNPEIDAKQEYSDDDHRSGALDLFQRGGADFAHFRAHIVIERFDALRPGLQLLQTLAAICYCHRLCHFCFTLLSAFEPLPGPFSKIWQGRRDSNPQVRFWRPTV